MKKFYPTATEGVAVLSSETVLPSPQRGNVVLRQADITVRMVIPDQPNFKFGLPGDKTVMRRCVERRGLKVSFRRAKSGPGSESAFCVAIFSPATKALKIAVQTKKKMEEFVDLCIEAVEEFLTRRPKAVPAPKVKTAKRAKRQLVLSQQHLARMAASG
jgi:hypothetical protein